MSSGETGRARILGDRYRLLRPLARGGMAEVWQAHDQTLDRDVAIKVLHPHLSADAGFVERFRREARAVARLSHPNVVSVFDTGVERDDRGAQVAFIVMELLRGSSLRALLNHPEAAARPTVAEAVRIAAESADGLAYAHRQGLVHRDVKPANIFVEEPTTADRTDHAVRFGRVRVVDFGIAKLAVGSERAGDDLTSVGSILGTAKYVSPEQVEGRDVDARSDVYSLGIVLYEMVCGRVPFSGASDMATAMAHVRSTPPPPRTVRPGISRALDGAILRCLAKRPDDRFATADELAAVLRRLDLRPDDAAPAVTRTADDRTPTKLRNPSPPGPSELVRDTERTAQRETQRTSSRRTADDATTVQPASRRAERTSSEATLAAPPRSSRPLLRVLIPLLGIAAGALTGVTLADTRNSKLHPVEVLRAQSFELNPDGENDLELPRLLDGDRSTSWVTEPYKSRSFGPTKSGVGVIVLLPTAERVRALDVDSATQGWTASVYVSDELSEDLDGWGNPVGRVTNSPVGRQRVTLTPETGRYVLLWITDLGPKVGRNAEVRISELGVLA